MLTFLRGWLLTCESPFAWEQLWCHHDSYILTAVSEALLHWVGSAQQCQTWSLYQKSSMEGGHVPPKLLQNRTILSILNDLNYMKSSMLTVSITYNSILQLHVNYKCFKIEKFAKNNFLKIHWNEIWVIPPIVRPTPPTMYCVHPSWQS